MEEVKKEVKKATPEQKKRTGNSVTGKPLDKIDTKPQLDSVTEEAGKAVVLTYGRMNPPTIGHEKLINKVKQHAKEHNADHLIVASHSQDAKKNPLTADQKLHHLHRAFPGTNIQVSNKEHPSFIHQLKKLSGKYDHVHLVVGSDRVPEFEKVANKYNGKEYHFKKIHVVSAGHRDPDAEGTEGMSASKMREHVKNNDYESFKKGVPSKMTDSHAKRMFHDIRSGMGLHEEVEHIEEKKALTIQQRQARARQMHRIEPKLERKRELAKRKIAGKEQLQRRAAVAAREIVKRRFSAKKGVRYQELTTSEKIAVDRAVEKKTALIKKIASRLLPKIRQAEYARFKSFTGGAPMQSMHSVPATIAASYEHSAIDRLFEQFLSKEQSRSLQTAITEDTPDPTNLDILLRIGLADIEQLQMFRKAMKNPEKSVKDPLLRGKLVAVLNKIMDIVTKDPSIFAKTRMKIQQKEQKALFKKSQSTGLPLATLEEVYTRGYENPHDGMSPEQSGFARVNSFIARGAAYDQDRDLVEGLKDPEDNPCWKGYKPVGTKKKNGKTVPNCVPEEAETNENFTEATIKSNKDGSSGSRGSTFSSASPNSYKVVNDKGEHLATAMNMKDPKYGGRTTHWHVTWHKDRHKDHPTSFQYMHQLKKHVKELDENFMDGKGPGKPGDAARHGLKGKSAAELKKIRSSDTASPRKKQLAHWMLNMHHNEETKIEGTNCKNCVWWCKDDVRPVGKDELNENGGIKPYNDSYAKMAKEVDLVTLPGKGTATEKTICEHEKVMDWVTERMCCALWDGEGTKREYKGTSPVMESLDENFNIAFASGVGVTLTAADLGIKVKGGFELHPSVEEVEEEVRSSDVEGVVVRTATGKTVVRKQKVNKKIIGTGNLTDGKPDDTV